MSSVCQSFTSIVVQVCICCCQPATTDAQKKLCFSVAPEEDWSIQSKRRQDKFQDQVVYQENLHHFIKVMLLIKILKEVGGRDSGCGYYGWLATTDHSDYQLDYHYSLE